MSMFAILSPLLLATAAADLPPCNPIPGWTELLADTATPIVVLGELHGSNEAPAAFADAVCLTAQSRRVVVAVEQPVSQQSAIDAFIASDGGPAARESFLAQQMWTGRDGRASEAYFRLFETLRQMRAAGTIEAVAAFQPGWDESRPWSQEAYEKALADALLAAARPDTTTLVLVGNIHAMLGEAPIRRMAGHLPADRVLTLWLVPNGGETWACVGGTCGPQRTSAPPNAPPRGVERVEGLPYSRIFFLGAPATVSPPQSDSPR